MNKLITIVGPTAVGKTDLTIALAQQMNSAVISGDAYQVYKKLDIGTAKPTLTERKHIKHYLIDIKTPFESYSVANFQNEAKQIINSENLLNKVPILSGGTGLYIQALLENYNFSNTNPDIKLRNELELIYNDGGINALRDYANALSLQHNFTINVSDKHRLYRAIELIKKGDIETLKNQTKEGLSYDGPVIGLRRDRNNLYERINKRVDIMVEQGLFNEVEKLKQIGLSSNHQSMKGIGYKEVLLYLAGEIDKKECIDLVKKNTRNFAKRQITWYKRMPYIDWIDIDDSTNQDYILKKAKAIINNYKK